MCGRISLSANPATLGAWAGAAPPQWTPRWNLAPMQPVLARINHARQGEADAESWAMLHWGWPPVQAGARPLINARAETVHIRRSFWESFRLRRCGIVVDGFYEWQAAKPRRPWFVRQSAGEPFTLAGLWNPPQPPHTQPRCVILTTQANAQLAPLHSRMPVILSADERVRWIHTAPGQALHLLPLLKSRDWSALHAFPVSLRANSPLHDDAICQEPATQDSGCTAASAPSPEETQGQLTLR